MALQRSWVVIISHVMAGVGLLLVLQLKLLPALLAGLLVYELIETLTLRLERHISGERARWLGAALLAALVIGMLLLLVFGAIALLNSDYGNPRTLLDRMMPVVERARAQLPRILVDYVPDSIEGMRAVLVDWLRQHANQLQLVGKEALRVVVQLVVGLVLGGLVALNSARGRHREGPLARELALRSERLGTAFHDIVFAQLKISALNTVFTGIFLLGVLPLFDVHLPMAKTLVGFTFVVGLLPVIGNLISNTAIFIAGLSLSLGVGVAALTFLILIHKLEYFLNARIVGGQIRSRAWELLLAMLLMEAAFGLAGLVAAPIYYAWVKRELEAARLI